MNDLKQLLLSPDPHQTKAMEEATDIARWLVMVDMDTLSREMALATVITWKLRIGTENALELGKKIMYDAYNDPTKGGAKTTKPLDFKEDVLDYYQNGSMCGLSTGFEGLDEFYTITKGQLNVVNGIPTHGKSEFMDQIACNMSQKHNWNWLVFSPENYPPQYHIEKLLSKFIEKPFRPGPTPRMEDYEVLKGLDWIDKHFTFINISEYGTNLESILMLAKMTKSIDGMIIDPWNEVAHNLSPGQSETNYIGDSLSKIRRFARANNIAVWVVAHPQKLQKMDNKAYPVPTPYDISGSAHWYNRADNCITVYREDDCVEIYIQKVKFKANGNKGMVRFRYEIPTGVYYELKH